MDIEESQGCAKITDNLRRKLHTELCCTTSLCALRAFRSWRQNKSQI
jgi:hypothetical protein